MEIKFIGTGGAFDIEYKNSSALVTQGETTTLIDCGFTVLPELVRKGVVENIDRIVITHLHDDHVGSLSGFLLYRKHVLGLNPITLVYPNEPFRDQIKGLLSYSLGAPVEYLRFQSISEVSDLGEIDTFGLHVPGMQTWAYYFLEGSESMVYSGDLGNGNILFDSVEELGLKDPLIFHELSFKKKNLAHTHYTELTHRLDKYRIFGYHCDPKENPADNKVPLVFNQKAYLF